jgi:hypothetical protein
MSAKCLRTYSDVGLLKSQAAKGYFPLSLSGRRMGTSAFVWSTETERSQEERLFHSLWLMTLWTCWLEPNGSSLWTWRAAISRWIWLWLLEEIWLSSGLWQFTDMHFGLCSAPATFGLLMETVFMSHFSWHGRNRVTVLYFTQAVSPLLLLSMHETPWFIRCVGWRFYLGTSRPSSYKNSVKLNSSFIWLLIHFSELNTCV